jgi:hypothetical protein
MSLFVCVVSVVCRCLGVVFDVSHHVIAFCSQLVVSAVCSVFCSVSAMAMMPSSSPADGSKKDRPTALTQCHHFSLSTASQVLRN